MLCFRFFYWSFEWMRNKFGPETIIKDGQLKFFFFENNLRALCFKIHVHLKLSVVCGTFSMGFSQLVGHSHSCWILPRCHVYLYISMPSSQKLSHSPTWSYSCVYLQAIMAACQSLNEYPRGTELLQGQLSAWKVDPP